MKRSVLVVATGLITSAISKAGTGPGLSQIAFNPSINTLYFLGEDGNLGDYESGDSTSCSGLARHAVRSSARG